MKSILIFCECFFPGYKVGGIAQSMLNLVKNLDGKFEFNVFTLNHEFRKPEEKLNVISNKWISFLSHTNVFYASNETIKFSFIKHIILDLKPDIIYLNGLYEFNFLIFPIIIARQNNIKVIQAPRGMLQKGALNIKPFKKKLFLSAFKFLNLHKNIHWHATDDQEIDDIKSIFGKSADVYLAEVMPNLTQPETPITLKKSGELNLITISLISEKKNHILVLKLLSKFKVNINYYIFGPIKDVYYWEKCEEIIKKLPKNIKVFYGGTLNPAEVESHLIRSHFFILPTFGENFGHALYEALNCGKPLIISNKTPWVNLEKSFAGWDLDLENQESFEKIIETCYHMNQTEYDILSNGAKKIAMNYILNANFENKYNNLFNLT